MSVTGSSGKVLATTFTEPDGRFRARVETRYACRVEASLAGFQAAQAPCTGNQEVRLTLAVAPIQEAVVVTATRGETPAGQVAASVSVFDHATIERRQRPLVADLLRQREREQKSDRLGALRREVGQVHPQRLLRDGVWRIVGKEMHAADDAVGRQHEIATRWRRNRSLRRMMVAATTVAGPNMASDTMPTSRLEGRMMRPHMTKIMPMASSAQSRMSGLG